MPNKHVPETINNLPFLYIKLINDRDTAAIGSLKKAIRLVKNVKNDAENEASAANLPSFDIAALMYHANIDALKSAQYMNYLSSPRLSAFSTGVTVIKNKPSC